MYKITLLGVDSDQLRAEQQTLLQGCGAIVASRRFHPLLAGLAAEIIPVTPVAKAVEAIAERSARMAVAILTSGDPLFYGLGRTLLARFPAEQVEIQPALSAMQLACARFKIPWDDMVVHSLHGRPAGQVAGRILTQDKMVLFTDERNSPAALAKTLLATCLACDDLELADSYEVLVGENLGLAEERLIRGSLAEIARQEFAPLNIMILRRPPDPVTGRFGLQAEEIHHSRGLITKDEVRAATLHKLSLPTQGVFWDVGAGSGSLALEAARLNPGLAIYAIEQRPEEVANLKANIKRFRAYSITVVAGRAPEALAALPRPDRVFIGGSGGALAAVIGLVAPQLPQGGRLVVNAVLAATQDAAPPLLHNQGLRVTISELSVKRSVYPPNPAATSSFNPIAIIVGEK